MATLPASAADLAVSHQVGLIRYSNGAVRRIIANLNRSDARIFAALIEMLEQAPENATIEYLTRALASVRHLNAQAYEQLHDGLAAEVRNIAGNEVAWTDRLYGSLPDSVGSFARVTAEQAYAAALARPFQGRLLREWSQSLEAGRMTRIRDTVRSGYLDGQTTSDIVRTLRGTRAASYADGLLEIDRRHVESVVRTAVSHTAGVARQEFYAANEEFLGSIMWLSTLDGRTTQQCRVRDHKRYSIKTHRPIGHTFEWGGGPGRLHWCCRSASLALLKGQTQLFGTRASSDGQVDANLTYNDWLRRQPAAEQDTILGPARGRLFRAGGLDVEDFSNNKGVLYTLEELRQKDAADFARLKLAA